MQNPLESMHGSLLYFEILEKLADNRWGDFLKFSAMAVSFLGYLEHKAPQQIKKIFELLAKVAFGSSMAHQSQMRYLPRKTR